MILYLRIELLRAAEQEKFRIDLSAYIEIKFQIW
jgi:hypothetical protein